MSNITGGLRARATGSVYFLAAVSWLSTAQAMLPPDKPELPNYDRRSGAQVEALAGRRAGAKELQSKVADAKVDFDPTTGSARWVRSENGFLGGPQGSGRGTSAASTAALSTNDPQSTLKAFLNEHSELFGHGAEALDTARLKREFTTAHSGLRTVVWEQQLDGIPVFEGLLIAHATKAGELVSVSSGFISDPARAADRGTPSRAQLQTRPGISAQMAVALAAQEAGESLRAEEVSAVDPEPDGATKHQRFRAPGLNGDTDAQLVWLPLNEGSMRLCWDVILTSRARGEMFRVLIDAETGEARVRHCLTNYISDATYRVYTSDSPSPFSPGYPTPTSTQPPLTSRTLLTFSALDTNASPNGWIDDGVNETRGNNVDAHTDRDNNNQPDLPRPQGSPFRVFDFPMDLAQSPTTYTNAAVVQLFYWNNWMHDRLYQLGFTEAAGNFQNNNFGRGGVGNDAVQADAQDGGGVNNANFSTPPDGSPGRMQMYLFTSPNPARDGDFDAEVMLHEYTHGLSNRRVGGGVGISALQTGGMGEGWSDFYGLTLLSESGDDVNGVYAAGGYVTFLLGGLTQNYYFGIRRYPYCTDMTKNPLTFKDIDPTQASSHGGIPRSPIIGSTPNEVHNMGEVWCVTLWEARATLINKYGWAVGNQLILQLATDGMNLSPANPNFLQARDAIIQADQVDNGGANRNELWAAFAKRGMGAHATSPSSSTASGVHEAFDVPDDLFVNPALVSASGLVGGPFTPDPVSFVLTNTGTNSLSWSLVNTSSWLMVSPSGGTLAPGGPAVLVNVSAGPEATNFPLGGYTSSIVFSNQTSGVVQSRQFALYVVGRNLFDNFDPDIHLALWSGFGGVVGSTVIATNYGGSVSSPNSLWFGDGGSRFATTIPVDTTTGGSISFYLRLANGGAWPWETVDLPGEGVVLEYSLDGATWTTAGTYDTTTFYNWTQVALPIPAGAQGPAVRFRWRQLSNSGSSFDHWALDNVAIDAGPLPPTIFSQPQSQTVVVGDQVLLSIVAWGSQPLAYQWRLNGTNLAGATTSSLLFTNVQFADAGTYSVFLSNSVATVFSSYATLTVNPPPPCVAPPPSLVSWWRGQGDATDAAGTHDGTVSGGVSFQRGKVGQAFSLNGVDGEVDLGNWFNLQTFSVAFWVKADALQGNSADIIDNNHTDFRSWVVQYNNGGLQFFWYSGNFGKIFFNLAPDTWQYLAVTVDSSNVARVYLDGQLQGSVTGSGPMVYDGTQFLRLGRWGSGGRNFNGLLDEVDVYNRTLSATEITALYNAGGSGKCVTPVPPVLISQPADQTVFVGGTAIFSVTASGTPPLSYQWSFNGSTLTNATNASLTLTGVTTNQAGAYAVLVTNQLGSALSSNAHLTVNTSSCAPSPGGLVAWWPAEGNTLDNAGTNHGTLAGNATYGPGEVGFGFVLDGTGDGVRIGNPPSLRFQNFTIEAWVKRASTNLVTGSVGNNGLVFSYGAGGYGFGLYVDGHLMLSQIDNDLLTAGPPITDTNFHHIAISKAGSAVVFYVDGVAYPASAYGSTFLFTTTAAVGARGDTLGNSFLGTVDEVSVYNRALSATELQTIYAAGGAGKCASPVSPVIVSQPSDQTVGVGDTASFSVTAGGTPPLSYQWRFKDSPLQDATNATLTLTGVTTNQAGAYSVLVTNRYGSTLSSNATLTVTPPLPCVPPPSGLVSWWRGQGDATDALGLHNGSLSGGVSFPAGEVGQAFSLNGADGEVDLGNWFNLQTFSVALWVNASGAQNSLADIIDNNHTDFRSWVVQYSNTGLQFFWYCGDFGSIPFNLTPNTWQYLVITLDSSYVAQVYLDGQLQGSIAGAHGITYDGTQFLRLGRWGSGGRYFNGMLDEVDVYNRALSASEITALYGAGAGGKCVTPFAPVIFSQPTNQTVRVGDAATFTVTAGGATPLGYQWRFNGTNLMGATTNSLSLSNVQLNQAGLYAVLVTNLYGSALSSNATLVVTPLPPCMPWPSGLVSWWRGQGDATDALGVHNGTLSGGVSFPAGEVGQAFSLNGADGEVDLGNWFNLQTFSVALWVNAGASQVISADIIDNNHNNFRSWVVQYNNTGLQFFWYSSDFGFIPFNLTPNTWQYLVITLDSSYVAQVYLDGQLQGSIAGAHGITYDGTQFLRLGRWGSGGRYFNGMLDEVDVYNRALSASEIATLYGAGAGGKCINHPPTASNLAAATTQNHSMSIPVEKFLLLSSDPDGDALVLSFSATSTNGGPVSLGGGSVTYAPFTNFIGADHFSYTVNDGRGGTGSAFVLIEVRATNQVSGNMFPPVAIPGGYSVSFAGISGRSYTLQRATNLSGPWTTLGSVTVGSYGIGMYDDTNSPPVSAFYRTIYP